MRYPTDLSANQKYEIKKILGDRVPSLRKYDFFDVLNAIIYVAKTGIQWKMLPRDFPHWKMVYHHFRSWSERGFFKEILLIAVKKKRKMDGLKEEPTEIILDSQSVKWGYIQSEKGIDGFKKVKGIKRHVAVDSIGYPLGIHCTSANVHDSKGAIPVIVNILSNCLKAKTFKADKGYVGGLQRALPIVGNYSLICVKSNYGGAAFVPLDGRWVVERTFSWMDSFRRLNRNYERWLKVATHMFEAAAAFFMLRYFR